MKTELYAHSLKNQPMETWQPLTVHLLAVAALAREFFYVESNCSSTEATE